MDSVYGLTPAELAERVTALGAATYRARQVREWAFARLAASYDEMATLPKALRAALAAEAPFPVLSLVREVAADDGLTRKRLLRLHDGKLIESVLMLYDPRSDSRGRATVCVSSQAGCAMGCVFCATGQAGFQRNLSAGEIVGQVLGFARALRDTGRRPLTNVVFMGMGEPLANYRAVWRAVQALNAADGFGLAARRITISTVGLVRGIERLAEEPTQVGLAVSLHAPDDELRARLVPAAGRAPLAAIIDACRRYVAKTGRRVTFEYCLMAGVNDADAQARDLAALLDGVLCHVNLIPVNPTADGTIRRPARSRSLAFQRTLAARGVACTLRVEKGVEISAACGQLSAAAGTDAAAISAGAATRAPAAGRPPR